MVFVNNYVKGKKSVYGNLFENEMNFKWIFEYLVVFSGVYIVVFVFVC